MRVVIIAMSVGLLLSVSAGVAADDSEEAEAAFKTGVEYYLGGQYEQALEAFTRANRLRPHWALSLNIGQCQSMLARYEEAIGSLEHYLANAGDEIDQDRKYQVLAEIDRIRRIVAEAKRQEPESEPPGSTARTAASERPEPAVRPSTLLWVGLSGTILTAGLTAVFGSASNLRYDDFKSYDSSYMSATGAFEEDKYDDMRREAADDVFLYDALTLVFGITAGALALGTTVVLVARSADSKYTSKRVTLSAAPGGVAVLF